MAQKRIIYQRRMVRCRRIINGFCCNFIILQNTIVGLLTLAVLSAADVSHLNLHDPHTYQPRVSYEDLVEPVYPPLGHHTQLPSHGYDIGLTSQDEYAADFPQSFDHHISGHKVNADLSAHTLDFQGQFDTLTADYKPIHEPSSEEGAYEMPRFENTVFHQVPAPQLGHLHHHGFDTEVQDFSDSAASHQFAHGRSLESVHQGLFTPSTHYDSVYNSGQHLQYSNTLFKK